MITDSLNNLGKYGDLVPFIPEILDFLRANDINSLTGGRHIISGDSVFILIQEYFTQPAGEKEWESHRKYIDIQLVLDGKEFMGYSPVGHLKAKGDYSEENDIIFYENDTSERGYLMVHKNHFCLFFPEDGHKPGLHVIEVQRVKKAVIKVAVQNG